MAGMGVQVGGESPFPWDPDLSASLRSSGFAWPGQSEGAVGWSLLVPLSVPHVGICLVAWVHELNSSRNAQSQF